jgi:hypothetical protein
MSTSDGSVWSASSFGRFTLEQRVSVIGYEAVGAQIRSGRCTEEKHLLNLQENELHFLVCPVRSTYTRAPELP